MHDVVFFYSSINRGGSELALLRYLKNTKKAKKSLLVYFKDTSDNEMIEEFKKVIDVKKISEDEVINTNVAVNCMISTTENGFFNKLKANEYVLWVQVNPELYSNYKDFEKYDRFLTTSDYIKSLVLKHPSVKDKKIFLANPIVDLEEIKNKSKEKQNILEKDTINLMTIARVSHEKGYDYIVEIAERLRKRNINFKWYMLGFVSKKEEKYYNNLLDIVNKKGLKDNLIFMGAHENPYKYLKDAYMQILLSKNEAWGLVVTEAKALKIPSIVSNNSGLKEQIEDGINGFLVDLPSDDLDYDKITDKIELLIKDKELYNKIVNNLENFTIDIDKIVEETDKCFFA